MGVHEVWSFCGGFGLHIRAMLWSSGGLCLLKIVQGMLSDRCHYQRVTCSRDIMFFFNGFPYSFTQDGEQHIPRSLQDFPGQRIIPKHRCTTICEEPRCLLVFGSILVPFWVPKWPPLATDGPLGGSKTALGSSWFRPLTVLGFEFVFLAFELLWGRFGILLGPFWSASSSLSSALTGRFGILDACIPCDDR